MECVPPCHDGPGRCPNCRSEIRATMAHLAIGPQVCVLVPSLLVDRAESCDDCVDGICVCCGGEGCPACVIGRCVSVHDVENFRLIQLEER